MKITLYVTGISILMSGSAYAGQPSALDSLLAAAGPAAVEAAAAPAAPGPLVLRNEKAEKALASDVLDLTPSFADFLAAYALGHGYAVVELDGARMTSKRALLAHVSEKLRFPGPAENWDAMIDLIGELPRVYGSDRIVVLVRDAGLIRRAGGGLYEDLRDAAEFACSNARDWSKGEITIKFAFVE
ncbi:MAG: barstar family protein [Elusimicrobiales bacterium]|nr:barstar family protein [Elusimicrobiales bacterium]